MKALKACNSMMKIWKSSLPRNLKVKVSTTTVESVLTYGAETWTSTTKLRKKLDECYPGLLRTALNIPWQSHTTNKEVYNNLAPISERLKTKRLRFARHCVRSTHEAASKIVMWQPTHGQRNRGPPWKDYIKQLAEDTGLEEGGHIRKCMLNRQVWRAITGVRRDKSP